MEGFVQLKVWKEYLSSKEIFYHSQALYYQNCLYRFQGVYEYVIMADTDDFLIPRATDKTGMGLHQLLHNVFKLKPKLGSVRLRWIRYYEPACGLNFTAIQDGNPTRYVNMSSAVREKNFKSIHKLSVSLETRVHEVAELLPGTIGRLFLTACCTCHTSNNLDQRMLGNFILCVTIILWHTICFKSMILLLHNYVKYQHAS